jgi:hypothetical protein
MEIKHIIGGIGLTSLLAIKIYANGGVCNKRKDLTDQVAIVTGGNTGIGK